MEIKNIVNRRKIITLIGITLMVGLTGCGGSGTKNNQEAQPAQEKPVFGVGEYGTINITPDWEVPSDAVFVDIRDDWERAAGYPNGSVGGAIYEYREQNGASMVNPDFTSDMFFIAQDKNKKIIMICHSGARTKAAAELLSSQGFTNVWYIVGGVALWQQIKPSEMSR